MIVMLFPCGNLQDKFLHPDNLMMTMIIVWLNLTCCGTGIYGRLYVYFSTCCQLWLCDWNIIGKYCKQRCSCNSRISTWTFILSTLYPSHLIYPSIVKEYKWWASEEPKNGKCFGREGRSISNIITRQTRKTTFLIPSQHNHISPFLLPQNGTPEYRF